MIKQRNRVCSFGIRFFGRRIGNSKWTYTCTAECIFSAHSCQMKIHLCLAVIVCGIGKKWSKWYAHNKAIHLMFLMKILPNVKFTRNYYQNDWNVYNKNMEQTNKKYYHVRVFFFCCWSCEKKHGEWLIINMPEDTGNNLLFRLVLLLFYFPRKFVQNLWMHEHF